MNKKVQSYLENNKTVLSKDESTVQSIIQTLENLLNNIKSNTKCAIDQAQQWLSVKGEEIKETLQNSTSKKAKKAVKTLISLTLMLSMTTMMSGCENRPNAEDPTAPMEPYEHEESCPNYDTYYDGNCEYCEPYK